MSAHCLSLVWCQVTSLDWWSNVATIGTAIIAILVTFLYWAKRRLRRWKLEKYLKKEGQSHTVVHLMANLKFTEDQVFEACFDNDKIRCPVVVDPETKRAAEILFRYEQK